MQSNIWQISSEIKKKKQKCDIVTPLAKQHLDYTRERQKLSL